MIFGLLTFFLIWAAVEWFSFQAVRTVLKRKKMVTAYQIISVVLAVYLLYTISQFDRSIGQTRKTMLVLAFALMVYIPKMVLAIIMMTEDLFRVGKGSANYLVKKKRDQPFIASRRKFVSQLGLSIAAIPFMSILYGIFEGSIILK